MLGSLWVMSARIRRLMNVYLPTNIAVRLMRTRRGLKWGVLGPCMAVPYLAAAVLFAQLVRDGGPGWLNLLVLLCFWNALKFVIVGPVSCVRLLRRRLGEARDRRVEPDVVDSIESSLTETPVLPRTADVQWSSTGGPGNAIIVKRG